MHEVAYETQLRSTRAVSHAAVATAIEHAEPERLNELASLLAHHWEHTDNRAQALTWNHRAAVVAGANDPRSSYDHWQKTRRLSLELGPTPENLAIAVEACGHILSSGFRIGATEEQSRADYELGLQLAEQAGNVELKAVLAGSFSVLRGVSMGHARDYIHLANEAVELAQKTGNEELHHSMQNWLIYGLFFAGRFAEARDSTRSVLAEVPEGLDYGSAYMSPNLNWSLYAALTMTTAILSDGHKLDEGIAQVFGHTCDIAEYNSYSKAMGSMMMTWYGRFADGRNLAQQSVSEGETSGTGYARIMSLSSMSASEFYAARFSHAAELADEALYVIEHDHAGAASKPSVVGVLAQTEIEAGRAEHARELCRDVIEFCEQRDLYWDPAPWLALVRANCVLGDDAAASTALNSAEDLVSRTKARLFVPYVKESRAIFARVFEAEQHAKDALEQAIKAFADIGANGHGERLTLLQGS